MMRMKVRMVLVALMLGLAWGAGVAEAADEPLVIVRDHEAEAAIVIPGDPLPVVQYAAEELQQHIEKATGAKLTIVEEGDDSDQRFAIHVGPTQRVGEAGIEPDELERNGFVIRRVGSDLLLVGHDSDGEVLGNYNSTRAGTLFAVYEFLESHLGVRWLWPGELGEFVPSHTDIVVEDWDQVEGYPYEWSQLRISSNDSSSGWSSDEARERFMHAQDVWLKRQRFSQLSNIRPGHNFEDWWERFGESHPEYFAQLPNGERRPMAGSSGSRITMCVAQPALWDQIVQDWVDSGRAGYNGIIQIGENDSAGSCTCDLCRAWDAPDPRFEESDYWSGKVDEDQLVHENRFSLPGGDNAPSLSDRYAKFYLAVQKRAEEVRPNLEGEVRVTSFVYQNYTEPPKETELNERIILSLVPRFYFPWTEEKRETFRTQWEGWYETGARMIMRPNYTHDGHNMPLFYARELGEDVGFALTHGAIATDFDSLRGAWAAQGPTLYMLGRIHVRPEMAADEILEEYYAAFGPAESEVRDYFGHWESVSQAITQEDKERVLEETDAHTFREWHVQAPYFWTDDVMAEGRALLEAAQDAASGDDIAEQRVAYLVKGLRHAELTLAVEKAAAAYEDASNDRHLEAYRQAINELEQYRYQTEDDFISNSGALVQYERRTWDRSLVNQDELGKLLPGQWKLQWDPQERGTDEQWHAASHDDAPWHAADVGSHWNNQPVGRAYRQEHGSDYEGVAWYRNTFTLDQDDVASDEQVVLAFGAVDAACTVWVNDQKVLDRPFPYRGDSNSWSAPFEVDITDAVHESEPNVLAVRVDHVSGPGGIWKPVRLITRERGEGATATTMSE